MAYTMVYYSAIKMIDFMTFAGKWMDLENVMLSEISQSPKTNKPNVFSNMWMLIHSGGDWGKTELL